MKKIVSVILMGIIVSSYYYPYNFTFLPPVVNTKMLIAVVGLICYLFDSIRLRKPLVSKYILWSFLLAVIFSLSCFFSETINGTDDGTYSRYYLSFLTWTGGAYAVCSLLRSYYGYVDVKLLATYLAGITVFHCFFALVIDNVPAVSMVVDKIFDTGQSYLQEMDRLYSIGVSLDSGGVRMCVVEILIAYALVNNNGKDIVNYNVVMILSLLVIFVIGCMISRTTLVGFIISVVYIAIASTNIKYGEVSTHQLNFHFVFSIVLIIATVLCVVLYYASDSFHDNMRFAFEGFFNWAETGVWRTDSTDKLNNVMWIWPTDTRDWIIGTGIFGNWYYSTDIGYCRFTLYCGLIGLSLFTFFFIYNGFAVSKFVENGAFLSVCLITLTLVVWIKVSTDIFSIYALLFCAHQQRILVEEL